METMQGNWKSSYLFGGNADFVEELYDLYLDNPSNVDAKWKAYFDSLQDGKSKDISHDEVKQKFAIITSSNIPAAQDVMNEAQTGVYGLISMYRTVGHKFAKLDPLNREEVVRPPELDYKSFGLASELENEFYDDYNLCKAKKLKLKDIIAKYEAIYCSKAAFEYSYVSDMEEQNWLENYIEGEYPKFNLSKEQKVQVLQKLTEAEGLEKYLHNKYVGQKRFSLEGGDSLLPAMDYLLDSAAKKGVDDVYLGMAHRGRLNSLVNITGKAPQKLFDEFDGNYPTYDFVTSGDVKYHKGHACEYQTLSGAKVKIAMAFNPSHLEVVNPVVQGVVRAKQDKLTDNKNSVMGVLIHGDSALIGLGTNQAVFNMSQTRAYGGLGLIHITVNNQVGFTTSRVDDNRSSRYSTDISKMVECPVIHVNADDLRSVIFAVELSVAYRQKFAKDIMIDLVCFRRHGHNEADDPTITQPFMYSKVKAHPGTRKLYADELAASGVIEAEYAANIAEEYRLALGRGVHINQDKIVPLPRYEYEISEYLKSKWDDSVHTAISKDNVTKISEQITKLPEGKFVVHPTIARLIQTRQAMANGEQPVDFGMAETLAYGSLLDEGVSVRITGEDAGRGTFSHRQAVWHDTSRDELNAGIYTPLRNMQNNSWFSVYDSILNEEGVLGFEYGYSLEALNNLVIWEAQFGDFANGAQVMIDQFIISAEAKWGSLSKLVMLLPHGYDGQGPEHSSARVERFLQLSAENNIQVVMPTTAAQMFHLLRRQAKSKYAKPLVIFMSKNKLRFKDAMSPLDEITNGVFNPVFDDVVSKEKATRVILCSGQVYYDLVKARAEKGLVDSVAIIRVEQLYPFPTELVKAILSEYKNAVDFVWAQEEPYNQGAWLQIRDNLEECLPNVKVKVSARPRAAAPACGTSTMHASQLSSLLNDAFTL